MEIKITRMVQVYQYEPLTLEIKTECLDKDFEETFNKLSKQVDALLSEEVKRIRSKK